MAKTTQVPTTSRAAFRVSMQSFLSILIIYNSRVRHYKIV